jgi:hypothetical protein
VNLRLVNHGGEMFTEVIAAFVRSAALLGHGAIHSTAPEANAINVFLVGHPGFMGTFRPQRNSVNVLYNFEQGVPSGHQKFDAILNIFSHIRSPRTIYAPVGYSPAFEADIPPLADTIDVLHVGPLTESRKGDIGRRYGHLITAPRSVFGRERDALIMQARINLIVRSLPVYHFPVLRYLLMACKRRFVLSEHHASYSTIDPARHLTLTGNNLAADIRWWLDAGHDARQEIAGRVYEDLRASCDYTALLGPALATLQRRFRA